MNHEARLVPKFPSVLDMDGTGNIYTLKMELCPLLFLKVWDAGLGESTDCAKLSKMATSLAVLCSATLWSVVNCSKTFHTWHLFPQPRVYILHVTLWELKSTAAAVFFYHSGASRQGHVTSSQVKSWGLGKKNKHRRSAGERVNEMYDLLDPKYFGASVTKNNSIIYVLDIHWYMIWCPM